MAFTKPSKPEKVYVKVTSVFDSTGYLHPSAITWRDGRVFQIDEVKDFRPAFSSANTRSSDCYTVVIQGKLRFLFFEKADSRFPSQVGRWFVEAAPMG